VDTQNNLSFQCDFSNKTDDFNWYFSKYGPIHCSTKKKIGQKLMDFENLSNFHKFLIC